MLRVVSLAVVPPSIPPRVRAAIGGDETATRDLLTEILPRVRNLVRYLVRGDEDVDDIVLAVEMSLSLVDLRARHQTDDL
jgi:hypothetical protein